MNLTVELAMPICSVSFDDVTYGPAQSGDERGQHESGIIILPLIDIPWHMLNSLCWSISMEISIMLRFAIFGPRLKAGLVSAARIVPLPTHPIKYSEGAMVYKTNLTLDAAK